MSDQLIAKQLFSLPPLSAPKGGHASAVMHQQGHALSLHTAILCDAVRNHCTSRVTATNTKRTSRVTGFATLAYQ